jgi:hypothetical protein
VREFPASPLLWEESLILLKRPHYQVEKAQQPQFKVAIWITGAGGCPLRLIYGFLELFSGRIYNHFINSTI